MVKKEQSVEIALNARALNKANDEDKHQMPNLENLMEMIVERLDSLEVEVW